jgi:hypothetical protein
MNLVLNKDCRLLDPVSLTYKIHRKGARFTAYANHDSMKDSELVLLILIEAPHTRALVSVDSIAKFFPQPSTV